MITKLSVSINKSAIMQLQYNLQIWLSIVTPEELDSDPKGT